MGSRHHELLGHRAKTRDRQAAASREVIEDLATSVAPLTESVNHLTTTMGDLVTLLAPMGEAERGLHRLEHLFSRPRDQP